MKRTALDLSQPIVMVWKSHDSGSHPWRYALWFQQKWIYFVSIGHHCRSQYNAETRARAWLRAFEDGKVPVQAQW